MKLHTPNGTLIIETHCTPEKLEQWQLADGLGIFWHGDLERQKEALISIAGKPESNVVVARTDDGTIVGFLTISAPDPNERWGKDHTPGLLELGGIEVARAWRGFGVARKLLEAAFQDGEYDDCIVFATAYSWCWDLDGMKMDVATYRKMLNTVFRPFGFEPYVTDEPNIRYYAGNALAARVGPNVPLKLLRQFLDLLVQDRNRPEFVMW